jgi:hypothetical protein
MKRGGRGASVALLAVLLAVLLAGVACWGATPLVYDPALIGLIGREGSGAPGGKEGYVGKWNMASLSGGAIEYWINPSFPAGAPPFASQEALTDLVRRAFQTWEDVPTCEIRFRYMGTTDRTNAFDGYNVVTFDPEFYFSPKFPGGIFPVASYATEEGATTLPGGDVIEAAFPCQVLDLDLVINPHGTFSLSDDPFLPELHDLLGILIHEIGHGLGLDHTGIAQATMYGYSSLGGGRWNRDLSEDETAAVSALYPAQSFRSRYGTISGTVRNHRGQPVFGAHVLAIDAGTGCAVTSTITGLLEEGIHGFPSEYGISSGDFLLHVPVGEYLLLVEPLEPTGQGLLYLSGVVSGDEDPAADSDFIPLLGSATTSIAAGESVVLGELLVAERSANSPAFDRRATYVWSSTEDGWVDPIRINAATATQDITMLVLHGAGIVSAGRIVPDAEFRFLNDTISITGVSVYTDAYLAVAASVASAAPRGLHVLEVSTPDGNAYFPGLLRIIGD